MMNNFTNVGFSFFQASDEERLKQLNDEQLLKLLEEAYHSKKLDDKNKSAFFKVRKKTTAFWTNIDSFSTRVPQNP